MDPDFLLIQRMKHGDDRAVEEFVRKFYPEILRYCLLRVDDAEYARDAAQETFERFFRSFSRYRHYGKAANYLYAIAGNVCRDYYRRRQETAAGTAEETEELLSPDPFRSESPCGNAELRLDIRAAFAGLPQELKDTAILFFCQERKQTEIAKILGISLPLVKYRIRRAREQLQKMLKEVY